MQKAIRMDWYCALIKDRYNKPMYTVEIEASIKSLIPGSEVRLISRDFGAGVKQNLVENYVFIRAKGFAASCVKLRQSKFIETVFPSFDDPAVIPREQVEGLTSFIDDKNSTHAVFGDVVKIIHGTHRNLFGIVVGTRPDEADVLFKLFRGSHVAPVKMDNLIPSGNVFKTMKFPISEGEYAGCHRNGHGQHRVRRANGVRR